MIYGLILAAGESKRMGQPKLLLPYGEGTVIESVLKAAHGSRLNATLVVCPPRDARILELVERFSFQVVINPQPEKGMLSSVVIGLNRIPQEAEAVVVILGDQPAVASSLIDLLIIGYRVKGSGIIVPVYKQKRGHPVLLDLKYREEISQLNPEIGLRALLRMYPDDVLEIPVNEPAAVLDIDTPEDYLWFYPGRSQKGKS